MRYVLGSRAGIGGVLGSGRGGAAAAWYLAGGVSAANCIAAYTPKGAASLAASYDNNAAPGNGLADGTYDAAPGVAPTFDTATGWTFAAASSQYLATGVTPANSGWSFVLRYVSNSDGVLCGCGTPPDNMFHWQRYAGAMYYANGTYTATAGDFSGTMAIAGLNGYRDGSFDKAIGTAWSGAAGIFTIGAVARTSGNITLFSSVEVAAVAIYNTTLTAPQVAAISSAMSLL